MMAPTVNSPVRPASARVAVDGGDGVGHLLLAWCPAAASRRPAAPARRRAAGDEPPTQIGGPPAWRGPGLLAEAAVAPAELVGPRRPDAVDGLVGQPAPLGERDAEHVELGLDVAGADAEDDPAAGQLVEGGEGLGRDERVPVGGDVDVAEQPGALGDAGEPAEGGDGVVPDGAHRLGPVGGDGDVVADGDVVEAGLVAGPGDGGELVAAGGRLPRLGVVGRLRLHRQLHAEAHRGLPRNLTDRQTDSGDAATGLSSAPCLKQ